MARVNKVQIDEAIANFQYEGMLVDERPYGNGHINDTFLLTFEIAEMGRIKVILQRMNKEVFTNGGTGVDVDAGAAMGVFAHNTGDKGHLVLIQFMGNAIDIDSKKTGIAKDDFFFALGGRVAVKTGLHVF